jgi:magnesium-transporting ATPase (P-type)
MDVNRVQTIVFDKTGTLTEGKPSVTDEILLENVVELVGGLHLPISTSTFFSGRGCVLGNWPAERSGPKPSSSEVERYVSISSEALLEAMSPETAQLCRDKLLQLAATAEQHIDHPLARAILQECLTKRQLPIGAVRELHQPQCFPSLPFLSLQIM